MVLYEIKRLSSRAIFFYFKRMGKKDNHHGVIEDYDIVRIIEKYVGDIYNKTKEIY